MSIKLIVVEPYGCAWYILGTCKYDKATHVVRMTGMGYNVEGLNTSSSLQKLRYIRDLVDTARFACILDTSSAESPQ